MPEPLNYAAITSLAYQKDGFNDAVRNVSEKIMAGTDDDVKEAQYQLLSFAKSSVGLSADDANEYVKFVTTSLVHAEEHEKKKFPGNDGGTGFKGKNANELWAYLMLTQGGVQRSALLHRETMLGEKSTNITVIAARNNLLRSITTLGIGEKVAKSLLTSEIARVKGDMIRGIVNPKSEPDEGRLSGAEFASRAAQVQAAGARTTHPKALKPTWVGGDESGRRWAVGPEGQILPRESGNER